MSDEYENDRRLGTDLANRNAKALQSFCEQVTKSNNELKEMIIQMQNRISTLNGEVLKLKTTLVMHLAETSGSGSTVKDNGNHD